MKILAEPATKACTKCGDSKSLDEFSQDRAKKDGRHSHCKDCQRAYNKRLRAQSSPERLARLRETSRRWRLENPEQSRRSIRNATLRRKYGITADEFEAMFERQGRRCAICHGTCSRGNGHFHVDHDHRTGQVRGILCQACNTTLGKMFDNPALLRAAADYLEALR